MADIKELRELVKGIDLLAVSGARVMKDGKIGASDLGVLIDLLSNAQMLQNAFTGLKQIPAEAKDLDEKELIELGTSLFSIYRKVQEILVKKSE